MENQKKFGVWMNSHHAVVVGNDAAESDSLKIIAHVYGDVMTSNSSEKNSNNHEKTNQLKYFKEIGTYIVNATHVHITGTGQVQEQFMHYLAETPQFKNSKTEESTLEKMKDDQLLEFFESKLN